MKKFTYRKQFEIIGEIVEDTEESYIIEANDDLYTWEKDLTVIEEIKEKWQQQEGQEIVWVADKPYVRFDTNGKPRKNGKVMVHATIGA